MRYNSNKVSCKTSLFSSSYQSEGCDIGIVLSGGGSRAAYQVGALKALAHQFCEENLQINTIVGSSIGAINGILLASGMHGGMLHSIEAIEELWRKRTFRNTFSGSMSRAFLRSVYVAISQFMSPGPNKTGVSVFDPSPLMAEVDEVIKRNGGLNSRATEVKHLAIMTTLESENRKPLLLLNSLPGSTPPNLHHSSFTIHNVADMTALHGFASAALPSILPPVAIDTDAGTMRLVDGGISQNHPVDPAVRLGAKYVVLLDVSGRKWWHDQYNEPLDTRPSWELEAKPDSFCLMPNELINHRCFTALGPILKECVGYSTSKFIKAVGAIWPLFSLLKKNLGEDIAFEVMSYVALDPDYINVLIELGYQETLITIREKRRVDCS